MSGDITRDQLIAKLLMLGLERSGSAQWDLLSTEDEDILVFLSPGEVPRWKIRECITTGVYRGKWSEQSYKECYGVLKGLLRKLEGSQ